MPVMNSLILVLKPLRASTGLYIEGLVVAILGFIFIISWFLGNFLRAWYPFIGSYIISRIMIWFVADVLKVRLKTPLIEAMTRRDMLPHSQELDSRQQADSLQDYFIMD